MDQQPYVADIFTRVLKGHRAFVRTLAKNGFYRLGMQEGRNSAEGPLQSLQGRTNQTLSTLHGRDLSMLDVTGLRTAPYGF